ncbi:MAG: glycosyltransferase family 4 protein [Candidatus Firestonebacteria bacterium]
MNILQVISSTTAGGRELFTIPLSGKLTERGHTVTILCKAGSPVDSAARAKKIPVLYTSMGGYFNPLEIIKTAGFLRRYKFDIIHSHWTRDLANLILAAKLGGSVPIVCTKHVYSTVKKMDIFHGWIFKNVKCVMAVCELVRKNVIETVPVNPEKVVTVYNGVDLKNSFVPGKYGSAFRKEAGYSENDKLICMAGRINGGKGQHILLEAVPSVIKTHPSAQFVFSGKPEGEAEEAYFRGLLARVKELGVEAYVRFLGFRPDVPAIMDASDIIVMCSVFETFGLILIEGMALAKPVIGTAAGGVLEIIENGITGRTFPPGESERLAAVINDLLSNPKKAKKLGESARRSVEDKFNIDKTIEQRDGIYKTFSGKAQQGSVYKR